MIDKTLLDEIIVGRVEPHIYAFTTNTIPNYLKVGDTYRSVSVRLKEWEEHYPNLEKKFDGEAKIGDVYFRDFSVHQFLETDRRKTRLQIADLSAGIYYSKEFFKETTADDVKDAIDDIQNDYHNKTQKYQFYSVETLRPEETAFPRTETYPMRPNQEKTVNAFKTAIANGRKNLLMYAVMRFGKSFTSMCCAVEMSAKLVVVVSAKADVMLEWKKTIESHVKFDGYEFVTAKTLSNNNHVITDKLNSGKKVVVFLTLQDLQGDTIKEKHQEVFGQNIDLLLVDETHFGARAEKYGEVLKTAKNYESDVKNKKDGDDFIDVEEADKAIKTLKANVTIHLSGTPYRILMGSEFKKEDIIAFYQFTDIVDDQKAWDINNFNLPETEKKEEWDNPYYGFPQMVRFAFRPNESSRKRLEELKKSGTTYAFSALFKPQSIKKTDDGSHKKFVYEREILDLLEVIDGSKVDDELLGFLDYDKLKEGKMCRHIVIVLPYCAACDALEELITVNKGKFHNLNGYEIINISGVDKPNAYKSPKEIKTAVTRHESNGKKTVTLTVNRMLTGSTVPEWDTMLYLKDTASPQEYDQAVFRLQNQYVKIFKDETTGKTIKFNMKPQTLLVDFDPNRMFVMQEKKSKIYNVNVDTGGNRELEKRIDKELAISPIITINKDKIERVVATDILEAVSNYQKDKGIKDEALETPVDLSILDDSAIRAVIELENEIGSKSGLSVPAHDGETEDDGSELDVPETSSNDGDTTPPTDTSPLFSDDKRKQEISLTKKVQSYYTRILLFSFITKDTVISLSDIIANMETEENRRIAKNLGLRKQILTLLNQKTNKFVLSDLDYKIQDLNGLSRRQDITPAEKASVAVNKFGKLGDAIVITPSNVCDDMVNLLPEEFIKSLPNTNGKGLDIAGTAGEFAVALHKRMTELGLEKDFIANAIYTIPKSPICYELTRKLYDMLELNTANIAKEFIATDMLNVKENDEIDYTKITALLTQSKPFETIKLTDTLIKGENKVTFEAVVGNPPYQETIREASEGNNKNTVDVYPLFQKIALKTSTQTCMIYPAKDYQRGKKTMEEKTLKYLRIYNGSARNGEKHIPDEDSIFGDTVRRIPGDVGVFHFDKNNFNDTIMYQETCVKRSKHILPLIKDALPIAEKLKASADSFVFSKIGKVCESNFVQYHKTSVLGEVLDRSKEPPVGYTKVLTNDKAGSGGKAKWYYIKTNDLDKKPSTNYKIVTGSAYPNESFNSKNGLEILANNEAFGRVKICIYDDCCLAKVQECMKYLQTNFAKFICLITPYKFLYYLPDFNTIYSDIDWSKSISEIDQQLYEKYGLTEEERKFIEKMIKPMGD